MAIMKTRGVNSHSVVYWYVTPEGKQQWESYQIELEAIQRKAHIDYLQKKKLKDELYKAAMEYKAKREQERETIEAKSLKSTFRKYLFRQTRTTRIKHTANLWRNGCRSTQEKTVFLRILMTATRAI